MRIASAGSYIQAMAYVEDLGDDRTLRLLLDGSAKCQKKEIDEILQILYKGIEEDKSIGEITDALDGKNFPCLENGYDLEEA